MCNNYNFINEIEAMSNEILNRLKWNEKETAIMFLNEMIDYIREIRKQKYEKEKT